MHPPMQSFGEISTQPSTPCSASGECGGSRSTRASVVASFRLRVRFKSGGPPALSAMESIMASIKPDSRIKCYGDLLNVLRRLFTMANRSRRGNEADGGALQGNPPRYLGGYDLTRTSCCLFV